MKKQVFGRKFKRDANERKALFKNLLTSLVLEERIKTTEAKAKAIKRAADKLITKARKEGENAYRALHPEVNQDAVVKLIGDIAPRFAGREGGYTRIVKIGKRRVADNAPMVYMEWTEQGKALAVQGGAKPAKKAKKVAKVKKESTQKIAVDPGEVKKQPKFKEVAKKLISRQKKGQ
jgi:large subunit ribosomal protein L17